MPNAQASWRTRHKPCMASGRGYDYRPDLTGINQSLISGTLACWDCPSAASPGGWPSLAKRKKSRALWP